MSNSQGLFSEYEMNLLVVEDERYLRGDVKRVFREKGWRGRILLCREADEAIRVLDELRGRVLRQEEEFVPTVALVDYGWNDTVRDGLVQRFNTEVPPVIFLLWSGAVTAEMRKRYPGVTVLDKGNAHAALAYDREIQGFSWTGFFDGAAEQHRMWFEAVYRRLERRG